MSTSVTQQAIRHISKHCAAALAAHGFKRQSPHFHRLTPGGLYHIINFQASQWGSRDTGRFTVNFSVTSPWLYTHWTGRPFPKNPASVGWPISMRIGALLPANRDIWWDVSADTDLAALAAEISRALTKHALLFFEQYPDSQTLLDRLLANAPIHIQSEAQAPLIVAILLTERGQTDAARDTLQTSLAQHAGSTFTNTICRIATRLGITLP